MKYKKWGTIQSRLEIKFWKNAKNIFFLAKNTGKHIAKTLIKNLSSNYSQTFLDHAKQSATDVLETATKRAVKKASETTDDFIFKSL